MTDERRPLLLAAACLLVFIALLVLVANGSTVTALDHSVRDGLARHPDRPLRGLSSGVTDVLTPLVDALVLAAGTVAVAWRRRRFAPLVAVGLTGWAMVGVVVVVKHALGRPAPHQLTGTDELSFPSGHTAAALVCFGALALLISLDRPQWLRPLLAGAAAITSLVAAALVYAGHHWLSDTVASIVLGVALLVPLHQWLSRWTRGPASAATAAPSPRASPTRSRRTG